MPTVGVGLRVVHDLGVRAGDDVHVRGRDVDAVAEHGLRAEDAVVEQAVHRARAVLLGGVVHVIHALAHVHVEAGQAVVGLRHGVERLVGQREERVPAEHGGDHVGVLRGGPAGEVRVLLDGLLQLLLAVAVRDLVAQARAHAHLLRDVLDGEERPGNLAEACVVVEDGGDAVAERLHHGDVRAGARAVEREVAVDVPPLLLEVLEEVGGVAALDGKAARQARVDVGVAVDEARHDEPAAGVEAGGLGVCAAKLFSPADRDDLGAVDRDGAVLDVGVCVAARDHAPVLHK